MNQNNTAAIYCNKYHNHLEAYIKKHYTSVISLYDSVSAKNYYELPRFHYTEVNNLGYDIIVDDLSLYERLKNKNNQIIYYMNSSNNCNINYKLLMSIMQQIDGVIVPKSLDNEFMTVVFNYTKEIIYV